MNIFQQCILMHLACSILCSHGTRLLTRFDRLEICDQSSASPMTISYIQVSNPVNENVRISMNGTIDNYTGDIDLEIYMQRCASREALDTCIPFTKLKPLNSCALLMMKNMAWSKVIKSIGPQLTCPVTRRADITVNQVTFDWNLFMFFSLENFYWKSTLTAYFGKEYTSFCTEGRVIKYNPNTNNN